MGAGFASTDRFLAEIRSNKLRPGYVLIGDEIFLYERCRRAVLEVLVPADLRDFCPPRSTLPKPASLKRSTARRLRR